MTWSDRNVVVTGGAASDPKLAQLAKDFVAALSDSKVLAVLKDTKKLVMTLRLDDKQINVRVQSEVPSVERATQMANGYSALLGVALFKKQGQDEAEIIKNVRVSSEARRIVLSFNMPRKTAGDVVTKLMAKNDSSE